MVQIIESKAFICLATAQAALFERPGAKAGFCGTAAGAFAIHTPGGTRTGVYSYSTFLGLYSFPEMRSCVMT